MMFLEKPRIDLSSKAIGGEESGFREILDATYDSMRFVENSNSKVTALSRAYDKRIDEIKQATGVGLENPMVSEPNLGFEVIDGRVVKTNKTYTSEKKRMADFQKQLEQLAAKYKDKSEIIAPHRSIEEDAKIRAKSAEQRFEDVWSRSSGGLGAWSARLAGGFYGTLYDPINVAAMSFGGGPAGAGVKGLAWMGLKQGAINADVEMAIQPFVQSWRKEAGLPYGVGLAATNIAGAALFGAGLDVGVRGAVRGVRRAVGKPYLGPPPTDLPPSAALDQAAANAPEDSVIRKAYEGDEAALRDVAEKTGAINDPAVRHAFETLDNEKLFPDAPIVDDGTKLRTIAQAIREQSGSADLPAGDAIVPQVTRETHLVSDDNVNPKTGFEVEGKPVSFQSLDPADITTDAAVFQFKSGGDVTGVTSRLVNVEKWDQISAGKAIVYQRANGEMVVADGHQRLGLAKRLADEGQDAKLDAYVFREADGWTPEDVRAYAALKNMRELSGSSVDMARIMRERPDLIDGSLPLSDAKLREAVMLARLAPEAFDAVVAGRLPPSYAALIGESVPDAARHSGALNEMAAADLGNINQARLYLKQIMELPTTTETQLTLFGEEAFTRSVMIERAKVLDSALRILKSDKRIFGLLEREAKAINEAGNVLAEEVNQAKAKNAAQLVELIETLATSKGTVATILNDAAASVSRGLNASVAAKAFVKRVGDVLDREGIPGLLRTEEGAVADLAPTRMEEPAGEDAKAQIDDLEAARDEQESLFALPGFYSPAIRAAESISMKKGTGEQFWKQITKTPGVKKDELDTMGLEEFLKGKKSVTKDEVLAFMRAHQIELDEKVIGPGRGFSEKTINDAIEFIAEKENTSVDNVIEDYGYIDRSDYVDLAASKYGFEGDPDVEMVGTKFVDYKVPGGENYREIIIRLPILEGKYTSKHFQDQEIVHIRVDDRTGPNGEKVLFINEAQSDLHQDARYIGGYGVEAYKKALADAEAAFEKLSDSGVQHWDKDMRKATDRLAKLRAMGPVPEATFKGDLWLELSIKRMLQYAVENNYDAISWARSDQIAKAVGAEPEKLAIQYDQKIGKFLDKYTKKWGGKVDVGIIYNELKKIGDKDYALRKPLEDFIENAEATPGVVNPTLNITPEMRASIMQGQPLMAVSGRNPTMMGATLSARTTQEMASIRAEIDKIVSRTLPPDWKAAVRENLTFGDLSPKTRARNPGVPPDLEIEGTFDPYERIVYVSMAAFDPLERTFEEVGHALKASRLIPDADYDILRAKATEINARERFDIDKRYGKIYGKRFKNDNARLESALEEESIMQMVAARARGDTFGKPVNTILDRVIKFLRAVRDMLGIKGFRTFDDVFEDIMEGRFAREAMESDTIAARFQAGAEVLASIGQGGEKQKKPLTPRQQDKLTRQIINEAAAEGKLDREDADSLIARLDALEKYHKDKKVAAKELAKEIDAEAIHRKRQAALTEQAKRRIDQLFMNFRDARGQPDPAKAMVVLLENLAQHELPPGTVAMQNHYHAIFGMAMADLDGMLHEFRQTMITGRTRNKAGLANVVRELHGQNTDDELAKVFATAAAEVMEKLRQRFNAAGGSIGKLDNWALPQWHDPVALIRAGRDTWIKAITDEIDITQMRNPLTGTQMSPTDLHQSLDWIYTNITSDGWAEREASMAARGIGMIANQRGDHRFIKFKDADAWLRYSERFGYGDDPLSTIVNHIKSMSKDIAAMEVLGPNPQAMLTYMQEWVRKQANLRRAGQAAHFPEVTEIAGRRMTAQKGSIFTTREPTAYANRMNERAKNMYAIYRGHLSASFDSQFAEASRTIQNINTLSKLGGAAISALGDVFWQVAARKFAGLPVTRLIGDIAREIGTAGEREARRAGVIAETYMFLYNESAREAAATSATKVTRYIADRVLSLSMLNGITRVGNHAMSMGIFAHLADQTSKPFHELSGPIQRMLRRHGLGEFDWEAIRLNADNTPVNADFLTPTDLRDRLRSQGLDTTIAERYLSMALMEAQYATLTGTLRGRAFMTQGLKSGTFGGELVRHLAQFKAFSVNVAILQIERMAREFVSQGLWRGAQYASFAFIGALLGGALIEQLHQVRNGKDPRDMTKKEFWGVAAVRSGGASIWGDLLYSAENRMGGGMASTVGGPTVGTMQDLANLTIGAAKRSLVLSPEEKTNVGREFSNMVRHYTPGTGLWYLRQAWNRILMDNLQRLVDPDAEKAFRRQILKARRNYGQEFWWAPGKREPSRLPNLRTAVPALQ